MKKSFFILLTIVSFSFMSVSSVEDYNTEKESETVGACCSSWVQYEGEWFEAVTVCGGSTVEDYIGTV